MKGWHSGIWMGLTNIWDGVFVCLNVEDVITFADLLANFNVPCCDSSFCHRGRKHGETSEETELVS